MKIKHQGFEGDLLAGALHILSHLHNGNSLEELKDFYRAYFSEEELETLNKRIAKLQYKLMEKLWKQNRKK